MFTEHFLASSSVLHDDDNDDDDDAAVSEVTTVGAVSFSLTTRPQRKQGCRFVRQGRHLKSDNDDDDDENVDDDVDVSEWRPLKTAVEPDVAVVGSAEEVNSSFIEEEPVEDDNDDDDAASMGICRASSALTSGPGVSSSSFFSVDFEASIVSLSLTSNLASSLPATRDKDTRVQQVW